jgi:hypothetical protein
MIEKYVDPKFARIKYDTPYKSWAQASGYFDGDGSVYVNTASDVVLQFALVWVDNFREQLGQLRDFMISWGIGIGDVLRRGDGSFTLQIASPRYVLLASKRLVPFCYKKRFELNLVIKYYEDKIMGTQTIEGFNTSVLRGVRVGKIRHLKIPQKYTEGKRLVAIRRGQRRQLLRRLQQPAETYRT